MERDERFERWLEAVTERHTAGLRRPEFLKAIRALSVRYVEARATLHSRSPLDSAGKRAAFAAYYAPIHFLTVRQVVRELGLYRRPLRRIIDLGCGTGAAGAGWAMALDSEKLELRGIDANPWAARETVWTWRFLGLWGRARPGDLVSAAEALTTSSAGDGTAVVCGWVVNELDSHARERLRRALLVLIARQTTVLIVEPIARRAVPWWESWTAGIVALGGRADEWRFEEPRPRLLMELDEAAGFKRETLTARTLSAPLPRDGKG